MQTKHPGTVAYDYPIQGGSIRLGANERGELCALSLRDSSERELLFQPGPFMLLNGLAVSVSSITERAIGFSDQDLDGEIEAKEEHFQIVRRMDVVRWRPSGAQNLRLCRESSGKSIIPLSDGGGILEIMVNDSTAGDNGDGEKR